MSYFFGDSGQAYWSNIGAAQQYSQQLQSGQLQKVRESFDPACADSGCAFNPANRGTIFLTKMSGGFQSPQNIQNYKVGPKPSSYSWKNPTTPAWPGTGPDPLTIAPSLGPNIMSPNAIPQPPSASGLSIGLVAITLLLVTGGAIFFYLNSREKLISRLRKIMEL